MTRRARRVRSTAPWRRSGAIIPVRAARWRCCARARCWRGIAGAGPMPRGASRSPPQTHALICSITKQFTCALLLDRFPDPDVLDADVRARVAAAEEPAPRTRDLCHNQSGLRDYWATAMLCGAPVEGRSATADAARLIGPHAHAAVRAGHALFLLQPEFPHSFGHHRASGPGSRSATCCASASSTAPACRMRVLDADTARVQGGTMGYEGSLEDGFRPAVNRILWTGDAGIAASLDDMIAWERFIDATRDDADGLYRRLSPRRTFRDGAPASYGFGLGHARLLGRRHRPWRRAARMAQLPVQPAGGAGLGRGAVQPHGRSPRGGAGRCSPPCWARPPPDLAGGAGGRIGRAAIIEPETGLAVRLEPLPDGRLSLHYAHGAGAAFTGRETASPAGSTARLRREDGPW